MKKEKKKINQYEIIFVLAVLLILSFIVITFNKNNLKRHCNKAVCNADNTICSTYEIKDKKTIKTWSGNCSKLK